MKGNNVFDLEQSMSTQNQVTNISSTVKSGIQPHIRVLEGKFFPLEDVYGSDIEYDQYLLIKDNIEKYSQRLKKDLGLRGSPFSFKKVNGNHCLRVSNITGSILLSNKQIEVIPKFIHSTQSDIWPDILLELLYRAKHKRYSYLKGQGTKSKKLRFIDHIALAYCDSLESALNQDMISTYKSTEEIGSVLRGRLLIEKTILNSFSKPHQFVCDVDYRSTDNQYNRLLAWAISKFINIVFDSSIKRKLRDLEQRFPTFSGNHFLPRKVPLSAPSQFKHYDEALEIASSLALGNHITSNGGSVNTYGYTINTEVLYEKYVEATLKVATGLLGGEIFVSSQDTKLYAEGVTAHTRSFFTRPDNVIYKNKSPHILVDAKYKKVFEQESGNTKKPQNSDTYQLVASLVSHGCQIGVLMYPHLGDSENDVKRPPIRAWKVESHGLTWLIVAITIDLASLTSLEKLNLMDQKISKFLTLLLSESVESLNPEKLTTFDNNIWSTT